MSSLGQLWLDGNELSGPIPPQLGDLPSLTSLSLSGNQISGAIPLSLVRLSLFDFNYEDTRLCEPEDEAFQDWLAGILYASGTGVSCERRLYLPLVVKSSDS